MERVIKGRGYTLSKQFYSDGVLIAPTGLPTVAITRADGTTVTTGSVAGAGVGPYTVTVTPANNLLLDTLTATWTATFSGQPNTYADTVEVAGDALFTVSELQALVPTATADAAEGMRTTVEDALERELGYAAVPRFARESLTGSYGQPLRVRPYVRAVRSVTVNGTALTAPQLAALSFDSSGFIGNYSWGGLVDWPSTTGLSNVTIGYEHGKDRPPERIRRAGLLLAAMWLASNVDERTTRIITQDGIVDLSRAGAGGAFGIPEVDAAVAGERLAVVA
jgi:hypothetical protein